jgi:hypothetical protein
LSLRNRMISRKYTIATVIAGIVATLAIGAIASMSFSTAAFAGGSSPKCPNHNAGSGDPHDGAEISGNPHDPDQIHQNPHDACVPGS